MNNTPLAQTTPLKSVVASYKPFILATEQFHLDMKYVPATKCPSDSAPEAIYGLRKLVQGCNSGGLVHSGLSSVA